MAGASFKTGGTVESFFFFLNWLFLGFDTHNPHTHPLEKQLPMRMFTHEPFLSKKKKLRKLKGCVMCLHWGHLLSTVHVSVRNVQFRGIERFN